MTPIARKIQRKVSGLYNAKPFKITSQKAVVSFTFDDVPLSAVTIGAKILEDKNASGTFYLSGSLANKENLDLEQFKTDDVQRLLDGGHEVGCHTYSHINIQNANAAGIKTDLDQNFEFLKPHIKDHDLSSFSYPFGCTSITAKNIIKKRFAVARGIKPGINVGFVDLSQLKANAIYDQKITEEKITDLIKSAKKKNGWLIFYTHDLSEKPTEFGCTPELFEFAVQESLNNDCDILNMRSALAKKCFK